MSNLNRNLVSNEFTSTELTNLQTAKAAIDAVVKPKAVSITPEQLEGIVGVDVDNYVFCIDTFTTLDAAGLAMLQPHIANKFAEAKKDRNFFEQLSAEEQWHIESLARIQRTKRVAGSEMFQFCNAVYGAYADAAKAGVDGAQEKYELLKPRYEKITAHRKKTTNQPE